ncbi:MAG: glycosyltransferase family 39 protein [Acidobacteria bacterium]|nr:glycosyltransferase family 39 protein [Acidobacteriota bacterium]
MALIGLLVPGLLGFAIVGLLWPKEEKLGSSMLLKICLAFGLGSGLTSGTYFLWLALIGVPGSLYYGVEVALTLLLLATLGYIARKNAATSSVSCVLDVPPTTSSNAVLSYSFVIALGVAAISFFCLLVWNPHGEWDGWAIWNLRARYLFRSGLEWKQTFSPILKWSHPDYPLGIPASISRCWTMMRAETVAVSQCLATVYTAGTVGLLFAALARLRSQSQAMLAVLVLIGFPLFVAQGASQYADVPLGFFYLATVVLIGLYYDLSERNPGLLVLAGMMAGLAAWTKNEGIPFLMIAFFALAVGLTWKKEVNSAVSHFLTFCLGALPGILILIYFKLYLAPPNYLTQNSGLGDKLARVIDPGRILQILQAFFSEITFAYLIPVLVVYALVVGFRLESRLIRPLLISAGILLFTLIGYFLVYLITPLDLTWQLANSVNRLFMQLWPSFLFLFFLMVSGPEQEKKPDLEPLTPPST